MFIVSGVINFGITCIYCNLLNWIAGKIYWLSTATHDFRRGLDSGRDIQSIMFFKRIYIDLWGAWVV